jgi:hypothetical protein
MRKYPVFFFAAIALSSGTLAQEERLISEPEIGTSNTAVAGSPLYSFYRVYTTSGAKLGADTKAGNWLLEEKVPAGTELIPVKTSKAFKACVPIANTLSPDGPCFIDDDGDGLFDRQGPDEVAPFRKLKKPTPYSLTSVSVMRSDTLKTVVLYQGADASSLRFSYREFTNGIARAAFTEELSVPRESLPAMIMVKNLQIEVLGVDGMGLRYKVVKVN